MKFFWVKQAFNLEAEEFATRISYKLAAPNLEDQKTGTVSADLIYATLPSHLQELQLLLQQNQAEDFIRIVSERETEAIFQHPQFPVQIGYNPFFYKTFNSLESQIISFKDQPVFKLAIIGMGVQLGDSLIFVQALTILSSILRRHFKELKLELCQRLASKYQKLFKDTFPRIIISQLPVTVEKLTGFDAYIDFEKMILRPDFNNLPMIDFYLKSFGIEPSSIQALQKRNKTVKYPRSVNFLDEAASFTKNKYIYVNLETSTPLRSIPQKLEILIINWLLKNTELQIIVFSQNIYTWSERLIAGRNLTPDLDSFVEIIRNARAIICADSAAYHLADSFDIPGFILFTTISPDKRSLYYPFTLNYQLQMPDQLCGKHRITTETQRQILNSFWDDFDTKKIEVEIYRRLRKLIEMATLKKN